MRLQLNAAYHRDSADGSNGDVEFERIALEAIPYWRLSKKFSAGAGLSYQLNPKMSGDFVETYKCESTVALVLSAAWHIDYPQRLDFRVLSVEYELEKIGSTAIDLGLVEAADGGYVGVIYHSCIAG